MAEVGCMGGEAEKSQIEGILSALTSGGAEVLRRIERFSSSAEDIAKEVGMEVLEVEERLRVLRKHGLVVEQGSHYRASSLGKYMLAVIDTMAHDIPIILEGGEKGAKELTIYHARLGERLAGKKGDIKEAVERTCRSVELLKRNAEALLRILS